MSILHLHLQEGFQDDTVRISVAGRTIWERESVTTRHQIGMATTAELDLPDDPALVRIEVPTRHTAAEASIAGPDSPYLLVNIDASDQLRIEPTTEMPRYA